MFSRYSQYLSLFSFFMNYSSISNNIISQTTNSILMIKPNYFQFNNDAAKDNTYMNKPNSNNKDINNIVMNEFNELVNKLEQEGITVYQFNSIEGCPDAVWPNNWFSTMKNNDGTSSYSLYPMKTINRRKERENELVTKFIHERYNGCLDKDWSINNENINKILEGTGSLVLDRINKIVYGSISERTDYDLLQKWGEYYNYSVISFKSFHNNNIVYHTNVIMSVGINFAVIATELINSDDKEKLYKSFNETNKTIIEITGNQVSHLCGNILELKDNKNNRILVMSTQAFNNYSESQLKQFYDCGINKIIHSNIETLETIGGGSCRCMIAELF